MFGASAWCMPVVLLSPRKEICSALLTFRFCPSTAVCLLFRQLSYLNRACCVFWPLSFVSTEQSDQQRALERPVSTAGSVFCFVRDDCVASVSALASFTVADQSACPNHECSVAVGMCPLHGPLAPFDWDTQLTSLVFVSHHARKPLCF